jgi:hypothetical protein
MLRFTSCALHNAQCTNGREWNERSCRIQKHQKKWIWFATHTKQPLSFTDLTVEMVNCPSSTTTYRHGHGCPATTTAATHENTAPVTGSFPKAPLHLLPTSVALWSWIFLRGLVTSRQGECELIVWHRRVVREWCKWANSTCERLIQIRDHGTDESTGIGDGWRAHLTLLLMLRSLLFHLFDVLFVTAGAAVVASVICMARSETFGGWHLVGVCLAWAYAWWALRRAGPAVETCRTIVDAALVRLPGTLPDILNRSLVPSPPSVAPDSFTPLPNPAHPAPVS